MTPSILRASTLGLLATLFAMLPASAAEPPAASGAGTNAAPAGDVDERIAALERELETMRGKEKGILGELERLDAESRLGEAEFDQATDRLQDIEAEVGRHDQTLAQLDEAQESRRRYLAFRLREMYKSGEEGLARRLLEGDERGEYWEGLRYASLLSLHDSRVLSEFQGDRKRAAEERAALEARRKESATVQEELARRREAQRIARQRRAAALEALRRDESKRRTALAELKAASDALGRAAAGGASVPAPASDIRRFRGQLDWPVPGSLKAGFGKVVHPEFRTEVPHPGWDIGAPFGAAVSAVFDGRVVFADWMRGYGLTAIVDHGGGVLSIYAHASLLEVREGDTVVRGQLLGKVGESGSLQGPYLYFEIRVDGVASDPAEWLRER